ncbi:hypothetical protein S83_047559, partial [Arachis hypogaea]
HHHGLPRACRRRHVRRAVVVFLDAALNGFSLKGSENPNLHHAAIYLTVATLGPQDRNQVRPCCLACCPSRRSARKAARLCLVVLLASVSRFCSPGLAVLLTVLLEASVSALWNTQGLNWPSSFEQQRQRTGDLDMLDWLKAISNRRRRKRKSDKNSEGNTEHKFRERKSSSKSISDREIMLSSTKTNSSDTKSVKSNMVSPRTAKLITPPSRSPAPVSAPASARVEKESNFRGKNTSILA